VDITLGAAGAADQRDEPIQNGWFSFAHPWLVLTAR